MNDWLGFLISLIYIFALIGIAEGLRKWRGYSNDFTRKVIHIGVGMLSWALPFLFNEPWLFIFACVLFMILNFLDWKYGFVSSMASSNPQNLGTVYFPLAAGVAALVFWDTPPLMVASIMPLALGDGLAPVVGRKFGRHKYTIFNSTRSYEGSLGFFVATLISTFLALWLMPGMPYITPAEAILPALVVAVVTTLVEGVSSWGIDNLTVTAAAMIILGLWPF